MTSRRVLTANRSLSIWMRDDPEREKTATHRFFVYTSNLRDTYRYSVCDGEKPPGEKTIAKFKEKVDAETFLAVVRVQYVNRVRE